MYNSRTYPWHHNYIDLWDFLKAFFVSSGTISTYISNKKGHHSKSPKSCSNGAIDHKSGRIQIGLKLPEEMLKEIFALVNFCGQLFYEL